METQNITLSLPKRTLKKIKQIAAQRQISVSGLLSEILEQVADQETGYTRARRRKPIAPRCGPKIFVWRGLRRGKGLKPLFGSLIP